MLKIRPEQSEAFQPVAEAAFVAEVVDYLRKTRPQEVVRLPGGPTTIAEISDEILSVMVRGGIARGREYGITSSSTLAGFVSLMFISAPNFDDHPLLKRALLDNDTDPNGRLEKLIQDSTEQNWEAVRQAYDASAWGLKGQEVN